ncbi:DUF6894 family protein [Methylobacterium nigriterrae]|uniref:DUF6894 family protein n=1 Tax=Methylobacterium nigriterrae TaxID=3127512 RepID=UPI00301413F8
MRYYFDTIINAGERQLFDADGQELLGLDAVRDEAMGILCEITPDALGNRDRLNLGVAVRDGRGAVVLHANLSLIAERPV